MRRLEWLKTQVDVTVCDPWPDRFEHANVFDEPECSESSNSELSDEQENSESSDFELSDDSDSE